MVHPLKRVRNERNLRLGKVAEHVQVSEASLSRVERYLQTPSLELVRKLCAFFGEGLTADDFLFEPVTEPERPELGAAAA